jgi:hypothetical protein
MHHSLIFIVSVLDIWHRDHWPNVSGNNVEQQIAVARCA